MSEIKQVVTAKITRKGSKIPTRFRNTIGKYIDIFGKDVRLALAAYNAEENAVIRNGYRIPPYPETLAYVPAVITAYDKLRNYRQ